MEKIKHKAVITAINGDKISLKMDNNSCSSCAIASFCHIKSVKEIEIRYKQAQSFKLNEKVILCVNTKTEKLGILLLYGLPTLIVFASLFLGQYIKASDEVCALSALISGGLYFLLLYLIRDKLKTDFEILRENK